jgi:hypothetical protein
MKKKSKIDRFLKWILKNTSLGFHRNYNNSLYNDANSVNSLSLLINMNNSNLKIIDNESIKDKFTRKKKIYFKNKLIEQQSTSNYLNQQIAKKNFKGKSNLKSNLKESMESKEEYLNRLWTPIIKKPYNNNQTADLINLDDFNKSNTNKSDLIYSIKYKKSDIVNLLLETKECSICENDLDGNDSIEILPCACIFHLYCVQSYLLFKKICPFCLKIFTKKQITSYIKQWNQRYWLT